MTGQEEIQYKVFKKFGLSDAEIRDWFNGPAQSQTRVPLFAACTLNATGQYRVTLSLR